MWASSGTATRVFFSSRRRHTRCSRDWSSDVCSSDLIQGACVGGGLLVASQCGLRICNESARFGVPVKNLGLVEAYDELQGMMNVVGRAAALEILLEIGRASCRERV